LRVRHVTRRGVVIEGFGGRENKQHTAKKGFTRKPEL
jgi:hypothetical protein